MLPVPEPGQKTVLAIHTFSLPDDCAWDVKKSIVDLGSDVNKMTWTSNPFYDEKVGEPRVLTEQTDYLLRYVMGFYGPVNKNTNFDSDTILNQRDDINFDYPNLKIAPDYYGDPSKTRSEATRAPEKMAKEPVIRAVLGDKGKEKVITWFATKGGNIITYFQDGDHWKFKIPKDAAHPYLIRNDEDLVYEIGNATSLDALRYVRDRLLNEGNTVPDSTLIAAKVEKGPIPFRDKRRISNLNAKILAVTAFAAALGNTWWQNTSDLPAPTPGVSGPQIPGVPKTEPAKVEPVPDRPAKEMEKPAEAKPTSEQSTQLEPGLISRDILNPQIGKGSIWTALQGIFEFAGVRDLKTLEYATDLAEDYVDTKSDHFEQTIRNKIIKGHRSLKRLPDETEMLSHNLFGNQKIASSMLNRIKSARERELDPAQKPMLEQIIVRLYASSQLLLEADRKVP